jgi:hypothetical protein
MCSPPDTLLDALADICAALLKDEQNETPPEATNLAGGATDGADAQTTNTEARRHAQRLSHHNAKRRAG